MEEETEIILLSQKIEGLISKAIQDHLGNDHQKNIQIALPVFLNISAMLLAKGVMLSPKDDIDDILALYLSTVKKIIDDLSEKVDIAKFLRKFMKQGDE